MHTIATAPAGATPFWTGLRRGITGKCPNCGEGALFYRYLKVNPLCLHCGLALGEFRADDAPPYFTILIVGHLIIPAMLILEQMEHPPEWVHLAIWLPLTLGLSLFLLPRIKGAVIGAQWSAKIRG